MPVGVMLASMSSAEVTEWMAYYELAAEDAGAKPKPKPATASDIRAAFAHRIKKGA